MSKRILGVGAGLGLLGALSFGYGFHELGVANRIDERNYYVSTPSAEQHYDNGELAIGMGLGFLVSSGVVLIYLPEDPLVATPLAGSKQIPATGP